MAQLKDCMSNGAISQMDLEFGFRDHPLAPYSSCENNDDFSPLFFKKVEQGNTVKQKRMKTSSVSF